MTMSTTTTLPGTVVQRPQGLSLLATLAIAGQLVLLASALLLPIWSQYSLIRDNISELALGRYGFLQTAAFVLAGLGTLALAFVIRQLTKGSWGSRVGSLLVGVYGAGAILSAVSRPTASTVGPICRRCLRPARSTSGLPS
jgi:hypothetical protein